MCRVVTSRAVEPVACHPPLHRDLSPRPRAFAGVLGRYPPPLNGALYRVMRGYTLEHPPPVCSPVKQCITYKGTAPRQWSMAESQEESETKTVALRVDAEQKGRWADYAEESEEYSNLSHLIRRAVEREIQRDGEAPNRESGGVEPQKVDRLLDGMQAMQSRIQSLEDELSDAKDMMATADSKIPAEDRTEVWQAIPESPEHANTAKGIAEKTDLDPDDVRVILRDLAESTETIHRREIEEVEEGDGMTTITTHTGRELEVEDPGTFYKRGNPLWWRGDG